MRVDFRAGRVTTGERREATRAVPGRRWEAWQGARRPAQAVVGPRLESKSPLGCLQPQQDAVLGAGQAAAPAGCIAAQVMAPLRPPGQPWMEGPLGPGMVSPGQPSSQAAVHVSTSVGMVLQGWGLQDGGRPEWATWDPWACFRPRWRLPRDMGEWQQPAAKKSLKKRRLRGADCPQRPAASPPVGGLRPCLEAADYGAGGGCWGLFWLRVFPKTQALRLFKKQEEVTEAKGPCLREVPTRLASPTQRTPPQPGSGHKWLTAAAGA